MAKDTLYLVRSDEVFNIFSLFEVVDAPDRPVSKGIGGYRRSGRLERRGTIGLPRSLGDGGAVTSHYMRDEVGLKTICIDACSARARGQQTSKATP